jgi:dTDP-4-dehydrorhamnose reductase
MRVVVFGAAGMLGTAMVETLRSMSPDVDVVACDHRSADITDAAAVARAIDGRNIDVLINCAAYNAVDRAEDEPVEALRVNAFAVRVLARAARAAEATLVHFSTDFVFDGAAERPYAEDDRPNPQSVYATSKMLGEWFAEDAPRWYVLRVESLFGRATADARERGSVAAIVNGLRSGETMPVFEDRTISPTYIPDAVAATRALLERNAPSGVYHCVNSGTCTWLEFGLEAARLMGVPATLRPVRMADQALKAKRPLYCALSNGKLRAAGFDMPTWQDALARHLHGSGSAAR